MMNMLKCAFIMLTLLTITNCDNSKGGGDEPTKEYTLAVTPTSYEADADGGQFTISVTSNTTWKVSKDETAFFQTSLSSGRGDATLTVTIDENPDAVVRTSNLYFADAYGLLDTLKVSINQEAGDVIIDPEEPDSIAPDQSGVESSATELVAKMTVGWNIGNSMEVPNGETGWGNPVVTKTLIDSVKKAGFDAIRIPCAWDSHLEDGEGYIIKAAWLARVKEVIDYCVDNDMYAMVNIHWDGGWLEEHPMYEYQEAVNEKQYAIWKQIAVYFRDYDEHLLFAGTNEVRDGYGTPSSENIEVQESYVQSFVDAVRSTGGKNAYRNLVVQTYNTNIDHGINYNTMPNDIVDDRLIVEVHYYDPYEFTIKTDAGYNTQWGAGYTDVTGWGQEDYMLGQFQKLKTHYLDKGIPVVIGEYSAMLRGDMPDNLQAKHEESRNYYHKTFNEDAKALGIVTFYWDNGYTTKNASGLFNRSTGALFHKDAIEAIVNVYQ